jgi:hypothetical protein
MTPPPRKAFSEFSGLRQAIIDNDDYVINHFPGLDSILQARITLIGTDKLQPFFLVDPSFEQFAAANNSDKALRAFLTHRLRLQSDIEEILVPPDTNTKVDILTLAILFDADKCLDVILSFIADNSFNIDFVSYTGRTPLWEAVHNQKWPAATKLVAHHAGLCHPQKAADCPLIELFNQQGAAATVQPRLKEWSAASGVDLVSKLTRDEWTADLLPGPGAKLISHFEGRNGDVVQLLVNISDKPPEDPLRVADPQAGDGSAFPGGQAAPGAVLEDLRCCVCGEREGLCRCPDCKRLYCPDHMPDHDCQE